MPELPEVETIVRALRARLGGLRLTEVTVRRSDLRRALPPDLPSRIRGRRWLGFRRRAKYALVDLEGGDTLLFHLGMSGRLLLDAPPCGVHEHLTFSFEGGRILRFVDPRRFGLLDLWPTASLADHPRLRGLGPEPLDPGFTPRVLAACLAGRRSPIKMALLDQKLVAGIGNIYACEALFDAGIDPRRESATLGPRRIARLAAALPRVLLRAIEAGGSSLRDYVGIDGTLGSFQNGFRVYDREGEPCPGCGTAIRRIVQSGRSTFFCPRCQR
ncbi:Formamidopyrimidine-DNA glycosylase [bacterium HR40]|nr:Formamidopyrimidine-DNA glycosylase [bacterium HR40]